MIYVVYQDKQNKSVKIGEYDNPQEAKKAIEKGWHNFAVLAIFIGKKVELKARYIDKEFIVKRKVLEVDIQSLQG